MSAMGQKQTYAVQQPMSALLPIATAKADSRNTPCPLYLRKRTCAVQLGMSALGQKRTYRPRVVRDYVTSHHTSLPKLVHREARAVRSPRPADSHRLGQQFHPAILSQRTRPWP